jgi:thiamine pyrophosphokinase
MIQVCQVSKNNYSFLNQELITNNNRAIAAKGDRFDELFYTLLGLYRCKCCALILPAFLYK